MASEDAANDLLFEAQDGIARITFNRPDARNAFTFPMYERLAELCEAINADNSIRVAILTGAGDRAFASGTDISQFRGFKSEDDALGYEAFMNRVLDALERCRVPTIAAICGSCTGGGAAIAGCCDLRIGTSSFRFGFPIARTLGNCLSMANLERFSALIGPARVKDIVFTSRLIEAEEALRIGLLNEAVEGRVELDARCLALAREISGYAPLTLRATKEGLRRILRGEANREDKDLILMCYMSRDFREGMEAFLEKRPPQWRGE